MDDEIRGGFNCCSLLALIDNLATSTHSDSIPGSIVDVKI